MLEEAVQIFLLRLPSLLLGLVGGTSVIVRCANLRKPLWKFVAVIAVKGILGNILLMVIGQHFWGAYSAYKIIYCLFNIAWFVTMIWWFRTMTADSTAKGFFLVAVADIFSLTGNVISTLIMSLGAEGRGVDPELVPGAHTILGCVIAVIYMILINIFCKGLFEQVRRWVPKRKKMLVTLFSVYYFGAILYMMVSEILMDAVVNQALMMIVILFSAVILGLLWYLKTEQKYLYLENRNLLLQKNLIEEYYASLNEQMELTRKLRHDIANHIQTLEELAKVAGAKPETSVYADSLRRQYRKLEKMTYTQNAVIDAAISNKLKLCREEEIRTGISITSFQIGHVTEIEILGIIYNLFDNAVESCRKVVPGERRFIEFSAKNVASQLVLNMKNSAVDVRIKNGKLMSTKNDMRKHGVGMSIIIDTVEKYDGYVKYQFQDGVFEILVILDVEKA